MSSRASSSISFYRIYAAVILLAMLAVLASCGYGVRKAPVASIALGNIKNSTFEPGMEDKLLGALSRELMRSGMRMETTAKWRIEGEINRLRIEGTAESEGVMVQYDVKISGAFSLIGPGERVIPLDAGSEFLVTFGGEGPLEEMMAGKERALASALESMAANIVSSILEKAPLMEQQ